MVQDLLFLFRFWLNMPIKIEKQVKCTVVDCKKRGAGEGKIKFYSFHIFVRNEESY